MHRARTCLLSTSLVTVALALLGGCAGEVTGESVFTEITAAPETSTKSGTAHEPGPSRETAAAGASGAFATEGGPSCPAGTAGSDCSACGMGMYCPGGSAPAANCASGSYDEDGDPATPCTAWRTCAPGSYQTVPGTLISDRACAPCPMGQTTKKANATSCTPE